jgi:hypothetical protein
MFGSGRVLLDLAQGSASSRGTGGDTSIRSTLVGSSSSAPWRLARPTVERLMCRSRLRTPAHGYRTPACLDSTSGGRLARLRVKLTATWAGSSRGSKSVSQRTWSISVKCAGDSNKKLLLRGTVGTDQAVRRPFLRELQLAVGACLAFPTFELASDSRPRLFDLQDGPRS